MEVVRRLKDHCRKHHRKVEKITVINSQSHRALNRYYIAHSASALEIYVNLKLNCEISEIYPLSRARSFVIIVIISRERAWKK